MDTNRILIESFIVNFYGYVAKLSYKHFNTIPRSFSRMDVPYELLSKKNYQNKTICFFLVKTIKLDNSNL